MSNNPLGVNNWDRRRQNAREGRRSFLDPDLRDPPREICEDRPLEPCPPLLAGTLPNWRPLEPDLGVEPRKSVGSSGPRGYYEEWSCRR